MTYQNVTENWSCVNSNGKIARTHRQGAKGKHHFLKEKIHSLQKREKGQNASYDFQVSDTSIQNLIICEAF